MRIFEVEQNTPEWVQCRLGHITGSSATDLLMKETCEGYKKLIKRIVEERITGQSSESKWNGNKFTERGHEYEPIAIEDYELKTFTKVHPVGFIEMNEWVGCSPDGLISTDTMIQIKCPIFATQLDYLESQKIPGTYADQMQFEMMVSGRKYNIFYSFHPNLPAVEIKLERDEQIIKEIQNKLMIAIPQVQQLIKKYRS